ncbi:uncharacterized protein LOC129311603 isoform X2 [Prosopis cineraria]|uniref:uncharacterized protein LOC129311603 isoform X2 n=1 Tax=Prosopis cineraria TaxID=364024 RepID=UPI00240F1E49|nr:uncharacterized protein LOC129311603 isoform X2 [Prosopis cineraria]
MFWRILGFGSSIVAFTCFALSPSFHELFGREFTRSVLVKAHVGFLVLMLTSLCSIWQDLVSQEENDEKGLRGKILNLCSFGAFALMSLSLSRQLKLGFEVGIFNFLFGSFLVLLMKMNFKLAPLAVLLCYVLMHIRSISDFLMEMRGRLDSGDTVPDNVESGYHSIDLQRMDVPEHPMHKNLLKEHAERSHIPPPTYQAVNIGLAHAPKFRSAVWVGGKSYTSENVFPNRRAAEQDVAKLAFKHITTGVKDEGLSLILEGPTSFKSILNDYARRMNLEIRYVDPVPQEGLSGFLSSLIFNGKRYIGDPAKNKKDAEQSAACAAVLSNLESFSF